MQLLTDRLDLYLIRRVGPNIQFLLMRPEPDADGNEQWQTLHTTVIPGETAIEAAVRASSSDAAVEAQRWYSADLINQFYDATSDAIVLAPVFFGQVSPDNPVSVGPGFADAAWCDLEEATGRLEMSSHRWAVRQIYELITEGGDEIELYRLL